jgi:hypothetical protein
VTSGLLLRIVAVAPANTAIRGFDPPELWS